MPPTRALQLATKTIPIVTGSGDPIGGGFARSYAQPGGNITGLAYACTESEHKKIELLRSAAPAAKRLIIALKASNASLAQGAADAPMSAARAFGFAPELVLIAADADLQAALRPDSASAMVAYHFSAPSSSVKIDPGALGCELPPPEMLASAVRPLVAHSLAARNRWVRAEPAAPR